MCNWKGAGSFWQTGVDGAEDVSPASICYTAEFAKNQANEAVLKSSIRREDLESEKVRSSEGCIGRKDCEPWDRTSTHRTGVKEHSPSEHGSSVKLPADSSEPGTAKVDNICLKRWTESGSGSNIREKRSRQRELSWGEPGRRKTQKEKGKTWFLQLKWKIQGSGLEVPGLGDFRGPSGILIRYKGENRTPTPTVSRLGSVNRMSDWKRSS
ncbi:hypothetical protein MG293_000605 [Ovis ammon polii]|uniref:Uncharacterized protein n=1 Tax=Ovis ammon polii TaxID=230172 RepID=A0AAD4YET1_OVIAM|nr:hypothetical protein MG293_000605 [Ovis ammon polii]